VLLGLGRCSVGIDGILLPLDGSSDGDISIKGLETPCLMAALKVWKTRGAPLRRTSACQKIQQPVIATLTLNLIKTYSNRSLTLYHDRRLAFDHRRGNDNL